MSESKALAVVPRTIDEVQALAEILSKSSLMPDALRGKIPDVVMSILAGAELGLAPIASIRGVHIVQGKPVLSADTMVALVLSSGLADYFMCIEETDAKVVYETKRKGAPEAQRSTWSTEDTKRAGLNTKDNWRLYTRAMMKARCKAALARDAFPDVCAGCYDPDELPNMATFTPREPDAIDAEIVEPGAEMIAEINAIESAEQLSALAPKINKLAKGSPERVASMAAFKARQVALTPEATAAP